MPNPRRTVNLEGKIIAGHKLLELLGRGSFGQVYAAERNTRPKDRVAIKVEFRDSGYDRLRKEFDIYTLLSGTVGIPKVFSVGRENVQSYLAMEELGLSLEEMFKARDRKFSLKTVLLIADQILERLVNLHKNNYVHKDIKPANFVIGNVVETFVTVHMVDFGLSEKYMDDENMHVPNEPRFGVGTPMYASRNVHAKNRPSRRDDLESLAYMLIFFLRGNLPWDRIKCESAVITWAQIAEMKENTTANELCSGFPGEFAEFLEYTGGLAYDETPDYNFIKNLFRRLASSMNIVYDQDFDWFTSHNFKEVDGTEPLPFEDTWYNNHSSCPVLFDFLSEGS